MENEEVLDITIDENNPMEESTGQEASEEEKKQLEKEEK